MAATLGDDLPLADAAEIRAAMEYYAARDWTDGLPVVPVTESYLAEFLARPAGTPPTWYSALPAPEPALHRPARRHQRRHGRLPAEYFPVVLAAWKALADEGYPVKGIWQSTTGTAPLLIVNGPVRDADRPEQRGQRLRLGLPGERHHRPGHPTHRHQRVRPAPAPAGPGHPGYAWRNSAPASRRTRS